MNPLHLQRLIRIGKQRFNLPIEIIWKQIYNVALPLITRNMVPWELRDEELTIWLDNNNIFQNV